MDDLKVTIGDGGEAGHVSDRLPEFVRGALPEGERVRIERHLTACASCRGEAEVVGLLAEAPLPRLSSGERAWLSGEVELRRKRAARSWRAGAWRAAAVIALLLSGVGVWRVVAGTNAVAEWSVAATLDAWQEDLEELQLGGPDVRFVLGVPEPAEPNGDPAWELMEASDVNGLVGPWEEVR
ncbi:MAG: zf-HC2 domain-containing protein [Gemmatimonadota bacterium]